LSVGECLQGDEEEYGWFLAVVSAAFTHFDAVCPSAPLLSIFSFLDMTIDLF
jgi:hypothetical protein